MLCQRGFLSESDKLICKLLVFSFKLLAPSLHSATEITINLDIGLYNHGTAINLFSWKSKINGLVQTGQPTTHIVLHKREKQKLILINKLQKEKMKEKNTLHFK